MSETGAQQENYLPIGDYAVIGDCRSAALISRDGSLDWLCLPRFDSAAQFAALLDVQQGGRFRIRPAGPFRSECRYVPDTNVLETTFQDTADGAVILRNSSNDSRAAGRARCGRS